MDDVTQEELHLWLKSGFGVINVSPLHLDPDWWFLDEGSVYHHRTHHGFQMLLMYSGHVVPHGVSERMRLAEKKS